MEQRLHASPTRAGRAIRKQKRDVGTPLSEDSRRTYGRSTALVTWLFGEPRKEVILAQPHHAARS
ncbi:hypothetical protein [Micromonospora sp. URMC 106]|uniref:hypothetical protein n=1 Tax=Micromonospora sp. URMC 106 TaxID=3423408 RepID=UPI003F53AB82